MPEWLNEFPVAVQEWNRETEILNGMGVMTVADAGDLALRCFLASEIQAMAAEINKEGRVSYMSRMDSLGNEIMEAKTNPKVIQLAKMITEYRQFGVLFGLNPASRVRLSVDPTHKKKSKFDGLINGGEKRR